ncbi:MAG TPA: NADP-dependent oxidoreductase [Rhodospirillaceae bacterium]|nr:NADP-dependent oxidoreductase [Rhodospirillaceae bacterium]MAX64251.1 NADP-dependent oxidoreductase [Rhodospirillaceae bacterium]MBB58163.1 NADP-dependent oxidoreductase [Rhodospirillaceae bacterium]HBM13797.1 NADP-dependent oxidoreductase [Rhodospirillaceae bacterium]|tara:strand:- start:52789 stop:53796 length:1008 start_codon:yes stop_codon:yes gene_type:complete
MTTDNKTWILDHHPDGMPTLDTFRMETNDIPRAAEGEVLGKARWLSVDPYMRGRISAQANYAGGVAVGEAMHGAAVAEVIESHHPDWKPGDLFETIKFGWREYAAVPGDGLTRVDPSLGPEHAYLSYLGMPGLTALIALDLIGDVKPGETVLVSAASGAVGQVVGQIAKIRGARAVAVASSQEKLDWCATLGFDAGINYRTQDDLAAAIKQACPKGVDVFFDNTAGPIHDAVMNNLALNARIIICGTISLAGQFEQPDMGERFLRKILVARARMEGFLIFDHTDKFDAARQQLAQWEKAGKLTFKTDIMDGIDAMPQAFLNLLTSQNFGKQVVRV